MKRKQKQNVINDGPSHKHKKGELEGDDSDDSNKCYVMRDDALLTFEKHTNSINQCKLHPELQIAATSDEDNCTYVWDTQTGDELLCVRGESTESLLSFNHNGNYLAIASFDGRILFYRIDENAAHGGLCHKVMDISGPDINWMCWYRSKDALIAGCVTGDIYIWRVPFGFFRVLIGPRSNCTNGILTRDDQKLFVIFESHSIHLWDLKNKTVIMQVTRHHPMMLKRQLSDVACDQDAKLYVSGDSDGTVLFCTKDGPIKLIETDGRYPNFAFSSSNESKLLAIGAMSGRFSFWNYEPLALLFVSNLGEGITKMIWISDEIVAATTMEGNIYGIYALTFTRIFKLDGHTRFINNIDYNPHACIALTVSQDKKAKIFRMPQLKE